MHDVSDMEVFVEVVRQGGFSAAGRRLGLATSVISDRVKALEKRLGVRLLNRTTRSRVLTESGSAYLQRATQIIDDIAAMEACVMEEQAIPRGQLRVTAPGPLGRRHVASMVASFNREHPHIQVHLTLDDRFSDIVREGFDVAIRGGPVIDSQLAGRHLFDTRRVVVASPDYLRQAGRPRTPEELKHHRCLIFNSESHFNTEWRFQKEGGIHRVKIEGALASTHSELPVTWAVAGLGLTQKSWWEVADHIDAGQLCTVLDAFEPEPVSFFAIHPLRSAQSRKVGLFLAALADYFRASFAPG
jgi:DNA-binding transcriptional LysR family regulator